MSEQERIPGFVSSDIATCALLQMSHVGTPAWWEQLKKPGTPVISEADKQGATMPVDFFWRDPEGDESVSGTAQVILEVNSVTDHHSWEPVSLTRLPGTDVWHHRLMIETQWSGSYSFIPLREHQRPVLARQKMGCDSKSQRQWYQSVMNQAEPDPFNPLPVVTTGHGLASSALHMPEAELEAAWRYWDLDMLPALSRETVTSFEWQSQTLNNRRRIWCFETGEKGRAADKPLVIFLDGQRWTTPSGTPSVLKYLTDQGEIAPACYLLVDSVNAEIRWQELSCNALFWSAIFTGLLPFIRQNHLPVRHHNILVTGQSLGGLSAMYAGLYWPQYVTKVVSLSGSYWWPDVGRMTSVRHDDDDIHRIPSGSLADAVQSGAVTTAHLGIFQSVGTYEGDMNPYNELMAEALNQSGCPVVYQRFCGGHDWLAWRNSLMNGLKALLPAG